MQGNLDKGYCKSIERENLLSPRCIFFIDHANEVKGIYLLIF